MVLPFDAHLPLSPERFRSSERFQSETPSSEPAAKEKLYCGNRQEEEFAYLDGGRREKAPGKELQEDDYSGVENARPAVSLKTRGDTRRHS